MKSKETEVPGWEKIAFDEVFAVEIEEIKKRKRGKVGLDNEPSDSYRVAQDADIKKNLSITSFFITDFIRNLQIYSKSSPPKPPSYSQYNNCLLYTSPSPRDRG